MSDRNWKCCKSKIDRTSKRYPTEIRKALDKRFYVPHASPSAQQANNCSVSTAQFMVLYAKLYVYVRKNCSCGRTSNQPTVTRREFVTKCGRKLTVMRFSWILRVFWWGNILFELYREAGITEEFGVVSHFKKLSNIRETSQRLTCGVAWREIAVFKLFFQEATVTSCSFLDMLEHYTVPQMLCDGWLQKKESLPNFWKYYPSVIKRQV
jgi:hypothetical protein